MSVDFLKTRKLPNRSGFKIRESIERVISGGTPRQRAFLITQNMDLRRQGKAAIITNEQAEQLRNAFTDYERATVDTYVGIYEKVLNYSRQLLILKHSFIEQVNTQIGLLSLYDTYWELANNTSKYIREGKLTLLGSAQIEYPFNNGHDVLVVSKDGDVYYKFTDNESLSFSVSSAESESKEALSLYKTGVETLYNFLYTDKKEKKWLFIPSIAFPMLELKDLKEALTEKAELYPQFFSAYAKMKGKNLFFFKTTKKDSKYELPLVPDYEDVSINHNLEQRFINMLY